MIRHLNGTGRKRIERAHFDLAVRAAEGGEAPVFDLTLDLSSYAFPSDARVRVEAWRSNASQRWAYGTVGAATPPPDLKRRLTEVPESAQFRVVVVAGDGSGRLLGLADKIRPVLPHRSLLPIKPTPELGDEVWRVDFGEGDLPQLLINSRVEGISEIVRNDATFRSIVMPGVLRAVLTQVVFVERADPNDDGGEWWGGWLRLANSLLPSETVPHLEREAGHDETPEALLWINNVVSAFANAPVDAVNVYNTALRGHA